MSSHDAARAAGQLLQWGLRARARPAQEPDYRRLVDRYLDEPGFRELVRAVADGIGLELLDVGPHGLVLAPAGDSPFALSPGELRTPSSYADDRLLDGLVQVAIAAAVFPRARDLDEDRELARAPLSVDEVADQLDTICAALEQSSRGRPDRTVEEETRGLYEAWRVYSRRKASGSRGRRSTRRVIRHGLEVLHRHGCFTRERGSRDRWRPTRRYQVLVQDLAATRLFAEVQRLTRDPGPPSLETL